MNSFILKSLAKEIYFGLGVQVTLIVKNSENSEKLIVKIH
jgi:hypothetical protein